MDNSIGLYIHIPFCKSKCNYCDFNSYSGREYLAGSYFNALLSEMKNSAEALRERPVRTIYIGGGTPSLVDSKYISRLLEICAKYFLVDSYAEISMESNPGTLSYDSLKAYRAAGVNRLSMGLQAWQDRLLKNLGRIHRRRQFVDNLEAAFKAGFHNVNVDLIFGLPGQTFEDWAETLEAVTALCSDTPSDPDMASEKNARTGAGISAAAGRSAVSAASGVAAFKADGISHFSCYSLKIEEDTAFGDRLGAGTLVAADDELDRRMYGYTVEFLAHKGYKHYEISNFAKPGFECRHNLVYWKALEYAGFGAGAHSYLDRWRFSNAAGIEEYIEAVRKTVSGQNDWRTAVNEKKQNSRGSAADFTEDALCEEIQFIGRQEEMSEFMILGLRLIDGVCSREFEARFGESLQTVYGDKLERLVKDGLLVNNSDGTVEDGYMLTPLGLDLANKVFIEFI